jgi:hypothetical protein
MGLLFGFGIHARWRHWIWTSRPSMRLISHNCKAAANVYVFAKSKEWESIEQSSANPYFMYFTRESRASLFVASNGNAYTKLPCSRASQGFPACGWSCPEKSMTGITYAFQVRGCGGVGAFPSSCE